MAAPTLLVNATALQTGHRYRGIGSYTAGLLDALTCRPDGQHGVLPLALTLLLQTPRPDDAPLTANLAARDGVGVARLWTPSTRLLHHDRAQWVLDALRVGRAVRGVAPRLYHATEPGGLVHVPGVATVATLFDLIPLHDAAAHFPPRHLDARLGYARYLHALQQADKLLAISEATRRDAVDRLGIAPERISVTPLAVDEARFYPRAPDEVARVVDAHGLRAPYILSVGANGGRASTYKNAPGLAAAFERFAATGAGADYTLVLAGPWAPRAVAALHAAHPALLASGRLRLLGVVPARDLPALYCGAVLCALPSLLEGFGLPVLEAMRCGTPVLTSTVSSLPEVAGDAALLVDPYQTDAIATGLARLADDSGLRADLRARGLGRARTFTWARTAAATRRVYDTVCG